MTRCIIVDTGPLGKIAHPRPNQEAAAWLSRVVTSGALVIIPEIADYELRRNMLLEEMASSLKRLDELKGLFPAAYSHLIFGQDHQRILEGFWRVGSQESTKDRQKVGWDLGLDSQANDPTMRFAPPEGQLSEVDIKGHHSKPSRDCKP
jgi:hypothetical protein